MIDFLNKDSIKQHLVKISNAVSKNASYSLAGTITKITGMKLEASGICVPVGTVCKLMVSDEKVISAEVIGFANHITYLMATEDVIGVRNGTPVLPLSKSYGARVGMSLLGRALDAVGNPIDGKGAIEPDEYYALVGQPINPLIRKRITEPLDVGIRAINALLTVGKGQRLGIFAGSGVGKSVLLGMMTRYTRADIVVVGLIGERGREVKEFIEENLGTHGIAKSVVIAAPSDTSPLMRVNGALLATAVAEYYRDKGFDVLLIIDSLTRYAHAQREISLSAGELPATKGFTPSVFAKLAQLVERSGNGTQSQGSITAFYTVLVEGDDHTDPVADHARSLLDGHIFLSRHLADVGHYPAIDIERSVSRVMPAVVSEEHAYYANKFKQLYSYYVKSRDLVNVGMYQMGADRQIDEALKYKHFFDPFLTQATKEPADIQSSIHKLAEAFGRAG